MAALLPLAEAQARLLALAPKLPIEQREVAAALGFFLASDLLATVSRPEAAISAMDGFAIRAEDGVGPWRLVGESAAGHPYPAPLGRGETVRIATGALLPPGADTVVIQENCSRASDVVTLTCGAIQERANVRAQASDFASREVLLARGSRLGAAAMGLALAGGVDRVAVRRPPRIALIDSGDELTPPGTARRAGQVAASNAAMLAAMLAEVPCSVRRLGPIPDRLDQLSDAVASCDGADIVVTSGGASVGDHDLVRPALAATGAELAFWKVAVKPGKPLLVARRGPQLILGLPGNPASAFVTAFLFLLPVVRAALGATEPLPRKIAATLTTKVPPTGSRAEFLRARWDGATVTPMTLQDSGALRPLAAANALIVRTPHCEAQDAGTSVPIHLLCGGLLESGGLLDGRSEVA